MCFEDFIDFIKDKKKIMAKPVFYSRGKGIEVINISDVDDREEIYDYLKGKQIDLMLEDWIQQHEEISRLYEKSVNPIRIISVLNNNLCTILATGITLGIGNEISNASCGDIAATVDLNTGIIKSHAESYSGDIYEVHPISGIKIMGDQIPYWKECINMVIEASKVVPEVGYVGWDIAITPDGPVIIEGNTSPGYITYQLSSHLTNQMGILDVYKQFL